MHAWASMPHSMTCWGSPRLLSVLSTLSVIMEKLVFVWGFKPSAPSSGTVGPKPLGYCSVKIWGMLKIRHACSNLAALLTMFVNWKILGLNFSCMSHSSSTEPLVDSLPILAMFAQFNMGESQTAKIKWRQTAHRYPGVCALYKCPPTALIGKTVVETNSREVYMVMSKPSTTPTESYMT